MRKRNPKAMFGLEKKEKGLIVKEKIDRRK